ncbi:MAG: hypothetical protein ACI9JL_001171 [Paracoccaceae bacterium]|jgi:hypothetical protein
MRKLFIGKPLHWLMIAAATGAMYLLGTGQFHRVNYTGFLFIVLGIAVACVALVLITYRRGDRITRDSLDEESAEKISD